MEYLPKKKELIIKTEKEFNMNKIQKIMNSAFCVVFLRETGIDLCYNKNNNTVKTSNKIKYLNAELFEMLRDEMIDAIKDKQLNKEIITH